MTYRNVGMTIENVCNLHVLPFRKVGGLNDHSLLLFMKALVTVSYMIINITRGAYSDGLNFAVGEAGHLDDLIDEADHH